MARKGQAAVRVGRLLGYARVSTDDQATASQRDELVSAGCETIYDEKGSGASRVRPELARLLKELQRGDILVVVRIDRLARSVSHLLSVIEDLQGRGISFRSLRDPIDTSTPQGMFSLQVLGAVAQLERTLIAERTKAGIAAAVRRGSLPGNPGMRARDPAAIRKISEARRDAFLEELIETADRWLPTVRRMRPRYTWDDVVRSLEAQGQTWTTERLRRAVRTMARQGMAEPALLARSPRREPDDHLMTLVAGIAMADPDRSLRGIAAQLEAMRERTPRGGRRWSASSVKSLLDRATAQGLFARG